jgi:hypothetical protein
MVLSQGRLKWNATWRRPKDRLSVSLGRTHDGREQWLAGSGFRSLSASVRSWGRGLFMSGCVMAESRQPTEEEVWEFMRKAGVLHNGCYLDIPRDQLAREVADDLHTLAASWLAQRDVVAAATDLSLVILEYHSNAGEVANAEMKRAADRFRAAVAAVVSGTPEPPTRFCGVCGHPSVSAYAGGWKCRDCGAVVSGTPPPEERE